jgi:hypothetical protein
MWARTHIIDCSLLLKIYLVNEDVYFSLVPRYEVKWFLRERRKSVGCIQLRLRLAYGNGAAGAAWGDAAACVSISVRVRNYKLLNYSAV